MHNVYSPVSPCCRGCAHLPGASDESSFPWSISFWPDCSLAVVKFSG